MTLTGYTDIINGYNSVIANGELPDANLAKAVNVPIGGIIAWTKTYGTADSGTTTSTSSGHLVQTGQNFQTTVRVGMIVRNTTDSTYSYVTAVNSDTDLTLNDNMMTSGETYTIYETPYLPDAWAECNGQVISDASSPYNGNTMPNLNSTQRFLRGDLTSGGTGGADSQNLTTGTPSSTGTAGVGATAGLATNTHTHTITSASLLPTYYEVVFIMRIK